MEPLLDFYYRYWFRVEVEGVENVPSEGGALIVSNHSGALPPDAPMIMQAIRHEHPRPRPLYMLGENWFKGYPGVGLLANKMGLVGAHPANAQRLLRDEGRLALVFPEGQKGSRKLYWQRYRLRRFGRGGFVRTAIRAGVPIVPVAVVGAEEAMPIFAHVPLLQRLTGLIYFPINHAFPHFGLAAAGMYMPAKFRIRFLEPVDLSALRPRRRRHRARAGTRRAHPAADPGGAGRPRTGAWLRVVRLGWRWRDDGKSMQDATPPVLLAVVLAASWPRAATKTSRTTRASPVGQPADRRDPVRAGHDLPLGGRRRTRGDHDREPDRRPIHTISLDGGSVHAEGRGPVGPTDTATIRGPWRPASTR